jgi:DNA mismatch endonuclease Vsr
MANDSSPGPRSKRPSFADAPDLRRKMMSAVRARDTRPELAVRSMLHAMGYRFRLHRRDLPGRPDVVLPGRRKVVLVHGCFWHQHPSPTCRAAQMPRTRQEYWGPKLMGNIARDRRDLEALKVAGWGVLVVWECELVGPADLVQRLRSFLGPPGRDS